MSRLEYGAGVAQSGESEPEATPSAALQRQFGQEKKGEIRSPDFARRTAKATWHENCKIHRNGKIREKPSGPYSIRNHYVRERKETTRQDLTQCSIQDIFYSYNLFSKIITESSGQRWGVFLIFLLPLTEPRQAFPPVTAWTEAGCHPERGANPSPPCHEDYMQTFKAYLQHRFNPLHIYCRMCDYGLPARMAYRLSTAYERLYRAFGTKQY